MQEHALSTKRVFEGRLLKIDVVSVELDDGTRASREIVRHPGAAVVLCRKPDGRFVLVRQYRLAARAALLEVVAGTLEPGEDPAVCARREVEEETGYRPLRMVPLGEAYPAPGYTEERHHFFYAEIPASPGEQAPDDDERVQVEEYTQAQIDDMIARGGIRDAKTLAVWLLFTRGVHKKQEQVGGKYTQARKS